MVQRLDYDKLFPFFVRLVGLVNLPSGGDKAKTNMADQYGEINMADQYGELIKSKAYIKCGVAVNAVLFVYVANI